MNVDELRYRRTLASQGLGRGEAPRTILPSPTLNFRDVLLGTIVLAILAGVIVYVVTWFAGFQNEKATNLAYFTTALVSIYLIFLPFIKILVQAIWQRTRPDFSLLQKFSAAQRFIATTALMFILCFIVAFWIYPQLHPTIIPARKVTYTVHHVKHTTTLPEEHLQRDMSHESFLSLWLITTLLGYLFLHWRMKRSNPIKHNRKNIQEQKIKNVNNVSFGLWLGESTGELAQRSHGASIAPNQQVGLFYDDLAQNILILGAIGSGKTTRAVHPLLLQLLDQGCGGLIFDIKGDFHRAVAAFTHLTGRHYRVLGPQAEAFNLLAGLSPEMAASFLKSAFLLSGSGRFDSFWIDTATELCRNALGVLFFLPEYYSLHGLHNYLFDEKWRAARLQEMNTLSLTLDKRQQRLLNGYQQYEATIFNSFDEKVKAGVKATIAQVLSPFNHPDLIDAFCTAGAHAVNLEEVLNGEVFLIDLPLARWGLGGKVAYSLIKLRFFNIMQNRNRQPEWDQDRYVFFICDEYQEIVSANKDGLSDLNFWDKSRSSKTIGIISAQSVSSFYAALGDRDLTHALLQNFRQKICFRTEDQNTIDMLNRFLGTVEVERITTSQNEGSSSSWEHSSSHTGSGTSVTTHDKPLLDGQFLRTLTSDHALVLVSYNGMSFDDVLRVEPFFVD